MAAIKLNIKPSEESNQPLGFTLSGPDKVAVPPNTFSWTLTDPDKNIINNRENVVETPAEKNFILLEGDDLALPGASVARFVTIKGTLDFILGGITRLNVPYTEEYSFDIDRKLNIPPGP